MTSTELIQQFELYVYDTSELSSSEELTLLNKIYHQILDSRPWEFLKKEWSGTTTGLNYIALPTDFMYFLETQNYTDNSTQTDRATKTVYVNNNPLQVVNWSDRRQYNGSNGYCYVDMVTARLYFTSTPSTGLSISSDYIYKPADLILSTSPIFPASYHAMIYHKMAVDDMVIQLFPKANSYAQENKAMYDDYMRSLTYYNSNLINI
jgi:hypothetical protein